MASSGFDSNLNSNFDLRLLLEFDHQIQAAIQDGARAWMTSVSAGALTQLVVGLCHCSPAHQHLALHLQPSMPTAVTNLVL